MSLPVEHGVAGRPQVALTFDDGPGGATARVLDVLGIHGVFGTFFMTGAQARRHPSLARAVGALGHEIGSHSFDHLDHHTVPIEVALGDMLDGAVALERVFGGEPSLYRAPYGHFTAAELTEADAREWTCVGWSVIGEDWVEGETSDSIAARVIDTLEPGAIVVLHDGRHGEPADHRAMLGALPAILDAVRDRDLEPVTVSALLAG